MNKFLKIALIFLLFAFTFFTGRAFATNIEFNLTQNSLDNTNSDLSNTMSNDTNSNTSTNSNTLSGNAGETTSPSGTATFSNINSLPESELGLTNILNILLITVGVVLILLSIAILIRLKN